MVLFNCRQLKHPRPLNNSKYNSMVTEVWQNVLTCDFHKLSDSLKRDPCLYRHSVSFESHGECLNSSVLEKCVSVIAERCNSQPLRAFKTVRSTMESAQNLLANARIDRQRLKLIYLLRDPRGHVNSMFSINHPHRELTPAFVQNFCKRLQKDLDIQRELHTLYPDNFLEVYYEDLADNPIQTANRIYQFVTGSLTPKEVIDWLQLSTNNINLTQEIRIDTQRVNSSATAHAWEKSLSLDVIKMVDRECSGFYDKTGYYKALRK